MAEVGDSLLALTRRMYEDTTMPQGDGTLITVSFCCYGIYLMPRQDYLNYRNKNAHSISLRACLNP